MRRFSSSILAIVLVFALSSCTTVDQASKQTLTAGDRTIVSVTLTSAKIVEFDDDGGMLINRERSLAGTTKSGEAVEVPIGSIVEMRTKVGSPIRLQTAGRGGIAELVLFEGDRLVAFDSAGGTYDTVGHTVRGTSPDGGEIMVRPGEIREARSGHPVLAAGTDDGNIIEVVTSPKHRVVSLSGPASILEAGKYIEGKDREGRFVSIYFDEVAGLEVRGIHVANTTFLTLGMLVVTLGILFMASLKM
jgi:hypothetical protein